MILVFKINNNFTGELMALPFFISVETGIGRLSVISDYMIIVLLRNKQHGTPLFTGCRVLRISIMISDMGLI